MRILKNIMKVKLFNPVKKMYYYWECPMITAHVYTWPEHGDVDYFLSK